MLIIFSEKPNSKAGTQLNIKKYLLFIFLLTGCTSFPENKQSIFKLEDYQNFCPSEARSKEPSSKDYIVYKSEVRGFYILPGDYILSESELARMPQNSVNSSKATVKITSIQDFSNYFKNQADELKKMAGDIGAGIFPTEIKSSYPDKKLAKELIVEKYISTKDPQIVFCGLTLKSDFTPNNNKYKKYIAKQNIDEKLNDDIYSGDAGKNYFTLSPYYK